MAFALRPNQGFTTVKQISNSVNNLDVSNNLTVGNSTFAPVLSSYKRKMFAYTAASTNQVVNLTAEQSGGIIIITLDDGGTSNINFVLPSVALPLFGVGINYTFILRGPVSGGAGDIRIYPFGYTQAAGVSAALAPQYTIQVISSDVAGNNVVKVSSSAGNNTANNAGGISFDGGVAVGPDILHLECVTRTVATAINTPQWVGYAYTTTGSAIVAS